MFAVKDMSQVMLNSNPIRVTIARPKPMIRARCCCSGGNFATRMDRKMMLSMPRTISSTASVKKLNQACGSESNSMAV